MSSCKAPVILVRFNETWVFGADFRIRTEERTYKHDDANSRFFAILLTRLKTTIYKYLRILPTEQRCNLGMNDAATNS